MKIPVYKIFWISIGITVLLLAIHSFFVMSIHFPALVFEEFLVQRFNLNAEANLPTWYATILLFSVAVAALIIYRLEQLSMVKQTLWGKFWLGFGLLFLFLSLDEAAQIHEIFDRLTSVKWVLVYAPAAALIFVLIIYYFFVIRRPDHALRNWVVSGLLLYILGALALEWVDYTFTLRYALRQIEYVLEEGLELTGTIMVLTGCLLEINHKLQNLFQEKAPVGAETQQDPHQKQCIPL